MQGLVTLKCSHRCSNRNLTYLWTNGCACVGCTCFLHRIVLCYSTTPCTWYGVWGKYTYLIWSKSYCPLCNSYVFFMLLGSWMKGFSTNQLVVPRIIWVSLFCLSNTFDLGKKKSIVKVCRPLLVINGKCQIMTTKKYLAPQSLFHSWILNFSSAQVVLLVYSKHRFMHFSLYLMTTLHGHPQWNQQANKFSV